VTNINLFIKYFTFRRVFNLFKVITSFLLSYLIKKPVIFGIPPALSIEPTNICNLKCPECPSGAGTLTRRRGMMSFETFKRITDEVYKDSFYFQLFFQGEPFLNKELLRMIDYAREKNIYTSVSTNAQLIDDNMIRELLNHPPDKIIFSIDGIDESSYKNYRTGGSFSKADNALRALAIGKKAAKKKIPFIEFQFIVMKQNEHLLKEAVMYSRNTGADKVVLKTMQVNDFESAEKFLPDCNEYSRYKVKDKKLYIKNKLSNRCLTLYKSAVITWDGYVVPCCFDKDAEHSLGSVNGRSLKEIWHSSEYNTFRKKILLNRSSVPMCTNCTEGMKTNIPVSSVI
jgi:radical SAM protein with 4Fe4S-binding SPASM domain